MAKFHFLLYLDYQRIKINVTFQDIYIGIASTTAVTAAAPAGGNDGEGADAQYAQYCLQTQHYIAHGMKTRLG